MTRQDTSIGVGGGLIDAVADWLVSKALEGSTVETLLEGCCARLRAAGIPLWRTSLGFRTLHPLFASITLVWRRGEEQLEQTGQEHSTAESSEAWHQSPFFHMLTTGIPFLRRQLTGPEALLDFPVLQDLRDQGGTDYLAYAVEFGGSDAERRNGIVVSWTCDRPGGFSESDIQALLRVQRRLAVACKVTIGDQVTGNILTAYLGPDAGRHVLAGQIRLGDGETIYAVIWFSDLRNSTGMADTLPAEDYLKVVNDYFDCTAGAVLANKGEVLRFIGDAVLAIFPIRKSGNTPRRACAQALAAAREAEGRLAELNRARAEAGKGPLNFGIGLHLGDVMFGNIGVPERLEFSVIGPAANEVARLEDLTKTLGRRVLVSGEFARHLTLDWESLGRHGLRGVGDPIEVFAPRQAMAPRAKAAASRAR